MIRCKGCGLEFDIWKLRDGLCKTCREADRDEPNLVSFYEDDPIYDILRGIQDAIVNLTETIIKVNSCESISGGHQFKNGKCEICDTKGADKNE